ncbi:MAG: GNAT family N-acetyltransferase, partial [Pseudomonadota bacterium]
MTGEANSALAEEVFRALVGTWPAAGVRETQGWLIRDGAGGGKRVSSALALEASADPEVLTKEMADPLVMVHGAQNGLDERLEQKGWSVVDPTVLYAVSIGEIAVPPPLVSSFHCAWPPLRIAHELWQNGGIGADRVAVMDRAQGPKISVVARLDEKPVGVAFAAIAGNVAMVHALEVRTAARRGGAGTNMMRAAAVWAQDHGAETLAVAVTQANTGGNSLYTSLNMAVVGHYHYRH